MKWAFFEIQSIHYWRIAFNFIFSKAMVVKRHLKSLLLSASIRKRFVQNAATDNITNCSRHYLHSPRAKKTVSAQAMWDSCLLFVSINIRLPETGTFQLFLWHSCLFVVHLVIFVKHLPHAVGQSGLSQLVFFISVTRGRRALFFGPKPFQPKVWIL